MASDRECSSTVLETAGLLHRHAAHLTRRLRATRPLDGPGLSKLGILVQLQQNGTDTAGGLAVHLGLQPQSLTRLLADMEDDGLIERLPDRTDHRKNRIELTATGRKLLADDLGKRRTRLGRALARVLTPSEQEFLRITAGLMERVAAAIEDGETTGGSGATRHETLHLDRQPKENLAVPNKLMEPRISIVTLGVSDLNRSIHFYRDGLGFPTQVEPGAPIAFFTTSGTRLSLCPMDRLAEFVGPEMHAANGRFGGFILGHCVREKKDVAEVLALAEKVGGKLVKPAKRVFWGGHSGIFSDPDGYHWEVAWGPTFKFDETGALLF